MEKWIITFVNGATCNFIPFVGTEKEAEIEASKMTEAEVWSLENFKNEYLNEIF